LALVLGAGELHARSAERTASPAPTHSTRDLGHPASTGLETCPSGSGGSTSPANATSTPAPAPGGEDLSATGRSTPAAPQTQTNTHGKATERAGAKRWFRRSSDGRVVPPAPLEEPRRGGVGTLIGITFA